MMTAGAVKLSVKPVFIGWITLLTQLPLQLFFTVNKKVIMFRDVKETSLRKGILQRIYGLGSIYLATLATGSTGTTNPFVALGFGNVSASGIIVRDISDPDGTFEKVRQLVDAQIG